MAARREFGERPLRQRLAHEGLGHHAPAEPTLGKRDEAGGRGHVVNRRHRLLGIGPDQQRDEARLQRILAIEGEHRRARQAGGVDALGKCLRDQQRRSHGEITHDAERFDRAALHRLGAGADRRHHHALAQQRRRMVLVFDAQIEHHRWLGRQGVEGGGKPAVERIGIDGKRHAQRHPAPAPQAIAIGIAQFGQRLRFEQRQLLGVARQRAAGRGRLAGAASLH